MKKYWILLVSSIILIFVLEHFKINNFEQIQSLFCDFGIFSFIVLISNQCIAQGGEY